MLLTISQPHPTIEPKAFPYTSIILVTYNSLPTLPACLRVLHLYTPEPHHVIVIDNASTDGTREYLEELKSNTGGLSLIANPVNVGLGAALTQGCGLADSDQVVFLHPDTLVTPNWLLRLTSHAVIFRHHAVVGPVSNVALGDQALNRYLRTYLYFNRTPSDLTQILHDHHHQRTGITRFLGLFCLLIPQPVLRSVGPPDPAFYSAYADFDYAHRLTDAGHRLAVALDTYVHHVGKVSTSALSPNTYELHARVAAQTLQDKLAAIYGPHAIPSASDLWGIDLTLDAPQLSTVTNETCPCPEEALCAPTPR